MRCLLCTPLNQFTNTRRYLKFIYDYYKVHYIGNYLLHSILHYYTTLLYKFLRLIAILRLIKKTLALAYVYHSLFTKIYNTTIISS